MAGFSPTILELPALGDPILIQRILIGIDVSGLYRGLVPNMLKVLPATGISYTLFSLLNERLQQDL